MRTCYVDHETRGIVDLVSPGELAPGWTITRIQVPKAHRGKGVGSRLLKRVLDDADSEGAQLWLEILPSGDLTYKDLDSWYRRHGFQGREYGYLVRLPKCP